MRTATILSLAAMVWSTSSVLRCGQQHKTDFHRYYFTAACTRSRMTQIAATYSSTLKHCKQFAARRRGLAINYVHRDLLYDDVRNYSGYTCLVFDCPEFDVQLSFDVDTVFDYYTTYARPMPNTNATCLPRLGVYLLHKELLNYTMAQKLCESENGYLADITNAPKSVQLAAALSKEHIRRAFIGLSQVEGRFLTSTDMPLDCLPYRAWAPGEPKDGRDCVTLSHTGFWYSVPCSNQIPVICELRPTGPLRPCVDVAWNHSAILNFVVMNFYLATIFVR